MTRVLVLEGGGLRGAFGAGVLSELVARGAPRFDEIVAVSSGAPTAAYYATGRIEDAITIWRDHVHGKQLVDFANPLRRKPIMDIDRLVGVFERVVPLDPRLLGGPTRLWCGVTDVVTGEARYLAANDRNVFELLRATMALPIAYGRVVSVDGYAAIDGGVAAPVALAHAQSLSPTHLTIVLTRPPGYRRAITPLRDRLVGLSYWRHAGIRHAMVDHAQRANAVAAEIEALAERGELTVIRPETVLPATRLSRDRETIRATIEAGRVAARRSLR